MQNQDRKHQRWPKLATGILMALACAAAALGIIDSISPWAPAPNGVVTRTAFASEPDEPGGAAARNPARMAAKPGAMSYRERCADDVGAAAVMKHGKPGARDPHLAVLLDWHMNAANGYGFGRDAMSCTAQTTMTVPIPIAPIEAYEMVARARDDSVRHSSETGWPAGTANDKK